MANGGETPRLNELKTIAGSEELHEAFKFLYGHEHAADELFVQYLGEKRDELRVAIDEKAARVAELLTLNHDEEESAGDVYDCERKMLGRLRGRMEVITALLFELRQGLIEKEESISMLEVYD